VARCDRERLGGVGGVVRAGEGCVAPEAGGLGRIMWGLDSRKEGVCWRRLMGSLRWMGNGVGICGEKFLVRNGTIAICSVPTHPLLWSSAKLVMLLISNVYCDGEKTRNGL